MARRISQNEIAHPDVGEESVRDADLRPSELSDHVRVADHPDTDNYAKVLIIGAGVIGSVSV
jgi:hypothetical protein